MTRLASLVLVLTAALVPTLWSGSAAAGQGESAGAPALASDSPENLQARLGTALASDPCANLISLVEDLIHQTLQAIRRDIDDNHEIDNCEVWCVMLERFLDLIEVIQALCGETIGVQARMDLRQIMDYLAECDCP